MSELERSRSRLPRSAREDRAYRLVLAGGGFALIAVVGLVLAIAGVIGLFIPLVAGVIALICGFLFRRTVAA